MEKTFHANGNQKKAGVAILVSDKIDFKNYWASSVAQRLSPAVSAGDMGLISGLGGCHMPQSNSAHAPQRLSLCSRARELQQQRPQTTTAEACVPQSLRSAMREATAMSSLHTARKISPCSPQREEDLHGNKNPAQSERKKGVKSSKTYCRR